MFKIGLIVFLACIGVLLLANGLNIAIDDRLADIIRVVGGFAAFFAAFFARLEA